MTDAQRETQHWHVIRYEKSPRSCIGKLDLNGVFMCRTLERPDDGKNTPNESAIPEGTYKLVERWSNHFGRNVLGLCDVPGRSDVEIHVGNFPQDVKGCIIVGATAAPDSVGNSAMAFVLVMGRFQEPADITIESIHLDVEKPDESHGAD